MSTFPTSTFSATEETGVAVAKSAAGGDGPLLALSANDGWGIVNYRRGLIAALRKAGYRIAVLAPDGPHSEAIRAMGASFHPVEMKPKGRSPAGDLRTFLQYRRQLKRLRPAAFLGFTIKPNIYGSMAARSLSIPVVNNITGLGAMFEGKGPLNRLVTMLYRLAIGRSAKVFFQNRDDRDLFVEQGLVSADRAALLPGSGVDLDHFRPVAAGKHDGVTFLLASRLLWAKGIREFVEAARLLSARRGDLRFRIAGPLDRPGSGAVLQSDLDEWEREGLIDYRGASSDIRTEIGEADCVVLPSYYREGVPRILLEAQAMAVPVIAADSVGCRDAVIDGETGLLCEPRSAKSLAEAMARIASLPAEARRALGDAGRARMEREFSETIVHAAYLEALLTLGINAT